MSDFVQNPLNTPFNRPGPAGPYGRSQYADQDSAHGLWGFHRSASGKGPKHGSIYGCPHDHAAPFRKDSSQLSLLQSEPSSDGGSSRCHRDERSSFSMKIFLLLLCLLTVGLVWLAACMNVSRPIAAHRAWGQTDPCKQVTEGGLPSPECTSEVHARLQTVVASTSISLSNSSEATLPQDPQGAEQAAPDGPKTAEAAQPAPEPAPEQTATPPEQLIELKEPDIPSFRGWFDITMFHGKLVDNSNKYNMTFSFQAPPRHNFTAAEIDYCRGSLDGDIKLAQPIDSRHKVLFILGVQKAGTTWLYNALTSNPSFAGAEHAYNQGPGPWSKELHFFNRWPMPPPDQFLPCFPESATNPANFANGTESERVLLDGTPEYLFNPDPVARAFSAWQMTRRALCPQNGPACPVKPFLPAIQQDMLFARRQGCTFNVPGSETSWNDCFQCVYSHVAQDQCANLPDKKRRTFVNCGHRRGFSMLDVSNYAAQLAWWMQFFPPDRFMIVTTSTLRRPEAQLEVLNAIRAHAGIPASAPFTAESIASVSGYDGHYDANLSPDEQQAVQLLYQYYKQPLKELSQLMGLFGMDSHFEGLPLRCDVVTDQAQANVVLFTISGFDYTQLCRTCIMVNVTIVDE